MEKPTNSTTVNKLLTAYRLRLYHNVGELKAWLLCAVSNFKEGKLR